MKTRGPSASVYRTDGKLLEYTLRWMTKPFRLALSLVFLSGVVDLIGFMFGLFYAGLIYDNFAHFLTTFSLVVLAAELYIRCRGRVPEVAAIRVLLAGAAVGLAGGVGWEAFEAGLKLMLPGVIYNPPLDSVIDTAFGTLGGALGAWVAVRHLTRTLTVHQPPTMYDKKPRSASRSG